VWFVPITELEPCNYINIPVASVEAIHGLLASTPQMSERLTPEAHSRPTSRRTPHLTAWTILSFASTAAVFSMLCSSEKIRSYMQPHKGEAGASYVDVAVASPVIDPCSMRTLSWIHVVCVHY